VAVIDWLFRDRRTGRIVVAQWPNVALWVFIVAGVVRRWVPATGVVATVALLWWAVDEIVRGVNPFRRGLGAVVAVSTVVGLVR
jgi:hypothetical protein